MYLCDLVALSGDKMSVMAHFPSTFDDDLRQPTSQPSGVRYDLCLALICCTQNANSSAEISRRRQRWTGNDLCLQEDGRGQIEARDYEVPEEVYRQRDLLRSLEPGRQNARERRALDCFCHVGPFGLNAAGDATYVRGVDISDITLELAQNKVRLNKENGPVDPKTPIDFTCADTVGYLPKHAHDRDFPRAESGPFDLISLDPPAFTKSKGSLNHAKKGYEEIDEAAVHLLPCGGYLATCSCSHFTTQELLSEAIQTAAHHMNVRLRQIELR